MTNKPILNEKLTLLAIRAAKAAGKVILDRPNGAISIKIKESKRDIVTKFDLQCDLKIRSILKSSKMGIISEEIASKGLPTDWINQRESFWIVDPIDGTANFSAHLDWVATSIGCWVDRMPSIGVVYAPFRKELFHSDGRKTFLNKASLKLTSSHFSSSLIAASFSGKNCNPQRRKKQFLLFGELNDHCRGVLRTGSAALNLSMVARGSFGLSYGFDASIWDIAGGLAIARNAGADYILEGTEDPTRFDYICGSRKVIQDFLVVKKDFI